jgi:hypothetical protein
MLDDFQVDQDVHNKIVSLEPLINKCILSGVLIQVSTISFF